MCGAGAAAQARAAADHEILEKSCVPLEPALPGSRTVSQSEAEIQEYELHDGHGGTKAELGCFPQKWP